MDKKKTQLAEAAPGMTFSVLSGRVVAYGKDFIYDFAFLQVSCIMHHDSHRNTFADLPLDVH